MAASSLASGIVKKGKLRNRQQGRSHDTTLCFPRVLGGRSVLELTLAIFMLWWMVIYRLLNIDTVADDPGCLLRGNGASSTAMNVSASSSTAGDENQHRHYSRRHHALVIPFRNREKHLKLFIQRVGPYLKRNFPLDDFSLYIVEQADDNFFLKGNLVNIGLIELNKRMRDTHCVILHDVDLVPKYDGVPYAACRKPIQLGSELEHFDWTYPYPTNAGGVISMHMVDWQTVNGMSNDYQGWGGEDDDVYFRLRSNDLLRNNFRTDPNISEIMRPPLGKGVFNNLEKKKPVGNHTKPVGFVNPKFEENTTAVNMTRNDTQVQNKVDHRDPRMWKAWQNPKYGDNLCLLTKMMAGSNRWKYDGLSEVKFDVLSHKFVRDTKGADSFYEIHHFKVLSQTNYSWPRNITCEGENATTVANQRDQPLEFVHITHTGGNIIERAGAIAGIAWGACHYSHGEFASMECPSPPDLDGLVELQDDAHGMSTPWHVPLQDFAYNPFVMAPRFTIVRNPYDRAIAVYFDDRVGYMGENQTDPINLNRFLQDFILREPSKRGTDFLPQHRYVFRENKKRMVQHVLHYETLAKDFKALMETYKLQVPLPFDFDLPPGRRGGLDRHNLTSKTVQMINTYAADDFRLFGYHMNQPS